MIRNHANTLQALDAYWLDIRNGAARAERNLDEMQPGFSSTTPGNGSPGGGTSGNTSIVERLVTNDRVTDPASDALHEYTRIVSVLKVELPKLRAVITQWDYAVAGELPAGTNERNASPRDINKHADPGCISCYRPELLWWNPVYRNALCRWCYDFRCAEDMLPPVELLKMRRDGKRMTTALVAFHIRDAKSKTKKKRRAHR